MRSVDLDPPRFDNPRTERRTEVSRVDLRLQAPRPIFVCELETYTFYCYCGRFIFLLIIPLFHRTLRCFSSVETRAIKPNTFFLKSDRESKITAFKSLDRPPPPLWETSIRLAANALTQIHISQTGGDVQDCRHAGRDDCLAAVNTLSPTHTQFLLVRNNRVEFNIIFVSR